MPAGRGCRKMQRRAIAICSSARGPHDRDGSRSPDVGAGDVQPVHDVFQFHRCVGAFMLRRSRPSQAERGRPKQRECVVSPRTRGFAKRLSRPNEPSYSKGSHAGKR
jgi:hypothetical protein